MSDNTIYVHNLFVKSSNRVSGGDGRTPGWWAPHTTNGAGSGPLSTVDTKYFNNMFVGSGLGLQQANGFASDYGVYYGGAQKTSWADAHSKVVPGFDAAAEINSLPNGVRVSFKTDSAPADVACPLITRDFVGVSGLTHQGIENHDGSALTIDEDMLGAARDATHPTAGPIEGANRTSTFTLLVGPDAPSAGPGGASDADAGQGGSATGDSESSAMNPPGGGSEGGQSAGDETSADGGDESAPSRSRGRCSVQVAPSSAASGRLEFLTLLIGAALMRRRKSKRRTRS